MAKFNLKNELEHFKSAKNKKTIKLSNLFKDIILKYLDSNEMSDEMNCIKQFLENDDYNLLLDRIKNENKNYLSLKYFRDESIVSELRQNVLTTLYSKLIIINNFIEVKEKYSKIIDVLAIAETLGSITDFCIEYNRGGKEIVSILNTNYKVPIEICEPLENLYNSNSINLKLDYIINRLTSDIEE